MQKEIWRGIKGYEGWYSVSSLGKIKSHKRIGRTEDKISKTEIKGNKYRQVNLSKKSISKTYRIHKLVACAFFGECPKNKEINHKDTNKSNNSISNLEYVTHKKNMNHAYENNLIPILKGKNHPMAKLIDADIYKIRDMRADGFSYRIIAKKFKVALQVIWRIVHIQSWKHIK